MAAQRNEISLLVLKKYFTCSLRSLVKYFPTLEEKFRISKRPCNVLFITRYLNTNEILNHFTQIVFWSERCGLL